MGQTRSMRNGGGVTVEYLVREKVPYVFGLSGHANVGLLDALHDRASPIANARTAYAISYVSKSLVREPPLRIVLPRDRQELRSPRDRPGRTARGWASADTEGRRCRSD